MAVAPPVQAPPQTLVGVALALGWVIADLFYAPMPTAKTKTPDQGVARDLPSPSELAPMDSSVAKLDRAQVLATNLALPVLQATWADSRTVLEAALKNQQRDSWLTGLEDLHVALMVGLEANDVALFHGYDLGRSLRKTCQLQSSVDAWRTAFVPWRVATIQERLGDLTDHLPPHSANAVAASIGAWVDWINDVSLAPDALIKEARQRITRQGHLWLAVLTGEKECVAMLDPENFIAASKRLSSKLANVMSRLLLTYWWQVLLVALAIAGVILAVILSDKTASVVASLGGLVVALGITRKGVVAEGEGVMKRLTDELWEAELDLSIGDALTKLPRHNPRFGRTANELPAPIARIPAAGPDPPERPTEATGASG